jgi:hypothetical protein
VIPAWVGGAALEDSILRWPMALRRRFASALRHEAEDVGVTRPGVQLTILVSDLRVHGACARIRFKCSKPTPFSTFSVLSTARQQGFSTLDPDRSPGNGRLRGLLLDIALSPR